MVEIDVVVCSIDDRKFANLCASLEAWETATIRQIVRINDAKSMCEGYNRGAEQGTADWILFCHDDIEVVTDDPVALVAAQADLDVFGVCGTQRLRGADWYDSEPNLLTGSILAPDGHDGRIEHQIFGLSPTPWVRVQALDGVFIMCRREVWQTVRFDSKIPGFTCYDLDFTYRSHLVGYKVGVIPSLLLYHASHVQEFSAEKLKGWKNTRKMLAQKLLLTEKSDNYVKHDIIKYASLDEYMHGREEPYYRVNP